MKMTMKGVDVEEESPLKIIWNIVVMFLPDQKFWEICFWNWMGSLIVDRDMFVCNVTLTLICLWKLAVYELLEAGYLMQYANIICYTYIMWDRCIDSGVIHWRYYKQYPVIFKRLTLH